MKVVATNIGKAVEINYHGKLVKTGIYKYPTDQKIYLEKEDVKGDSVLDRRYHGGTDKACYWYSEQHYKFWQSRYPDLDWHYGMFGENLSISDLDEDEVKIGDKYRIGEAVVQVSQPRQPCFKLNHRFKSDTMVNEFIKAACPGVYVRVIKEGNVQAGDSLELLERNKDSLSVREVFKMLYQADKNQKFLEMALNDPALAASCKKDLQR